MPRPRRGFIPDLSVHVIQRGHNRTSVFRDDADYLRFLAILRDVAPERGIRVHGYVLMTTHIHLIVTPNHKKALPETMRSLGSRYVPYYNRKYDCIGTLWTGRYRALLIEDEQYWWTCLRYIEQNPVRADMVRTPDCYRWSSYHAHALGQWPPWLTPHPIYTALGGTTQERQARYRRLCGEPVSDDDLSLLSVRHGSDPGPTPVRPSRESSPTHGSDKTQSDPSSSPAPRRSVAASSSPARGDTSRG